MPGTFAQILTFVRSVTVALKLMFAFSVTVHAVPSVKYASEQFELMSEERQGKLKLGLDLL